MELRPFFETVTVEPNASWAFLDRTLDDGIPFEWHIHPEYELTLTLNSCGFRYVGEDVSPYTDGDLVLIGPGVPHSWCSRSVVDSSLPHTALVIWFSAAWADNLTKCFPEFALLLELLDQARKGVSFSEGAKTDIAPLIGAMRTASPAERLVILFDVLIRLCRDVGRSTLSNIATEEVFHATADPRIARVLNYLNQHFAQTISVSELADLACVSVSAYHRLFKRHTRQSSIDYLTKLRVGKACALLITGDAPISTIAGQVGFSNQALFNRQFSKLKGETPSVFRRRHREVWTS